MPAEIRRSALARVKKLRQFVDALGPPRAYRKLHGILDALESQLDDGNYSRHAVMRLCEAFLATAELYDIPEAPANRMEDAACALVTLVEERR